MAKPGYEKQTTVGGADGGHTRSNTIVRILEKKKKEKKCIKELKMCQS